MHIYPNKLKPQTFQKDRVEFLIQKHEKERIEKENEDQHKGLWEFKDDSPKNAKQMQSQIASAVATGKDSLVTLNQKRESLNLSALTVTGDAEQGIFAD